MNKGNWKIGSRWSDGCHGLRRNFIGKREWKGTDGNISEFSEGSGLGQALSKLPRKLTINSFANTL